MDDADAVSILELADELQVRKQRIFKLLPRLGIATRLRRDPDRGNQNIATVSHQQASAIRRELARPTIIISGDASLDSPATSLAEDPGHFYLIQLEPSHDPGRFKVGFTVELDGRLQKHRCSAPFAKYVRTWRCRRVWERAAIDCATAGCERLHTEVFRADSLEGVAERADAFFQIMPRIAALDDADTMGQESDNPSEMHDANAASDDGG